MIRLAERLAAAEQRIAQLEGRIEQLTAQLAAIRQPPAVVVPTYPNPSPPWQPTITRGGELRTTTPGEVGTVTWNSPFTCAVCTNPLPHVVCNLGDSEVPADA